MYGAQIYRVLGVYFLCLWSWGALGMGMYRVVLDTPLKFDLLSTTHLEMNQTVINKPWGVLGAFCGPPENLVCDFRVMGSCFSRPDTNHLECSHNQWCCRSLCSNGFLEFGVCFARRRFRVRLLFFKGGRTQKLQGSAPKNSFGPFLCF